MRSKAIVGLVVMSVAATLAYAHAPGVSHSYENGQPVITVRLVPDEAAVAKRIDALAPMPAHSGGPDDPGTPAAETLETFEPSANDGAGDPMGAEPANELPTADNGPGPEAAAIPRYPSVKPALKPNTEIGVGGVLDLTPPVAAEPDQPRPMRLNSVQRPRTVADRNARERREQKPRPARIRTEAPAAARSEPDPLDEALPPRVIEPPPVNAMQLPPPKAEERVAAGN